MAAIKHPLLPPGTKVGERVITGYEWVAHQYRGHTYRSLQYKVLCKCGREDIVPTSNIRKGVSDSCRECGAKKHSLVPGTKIGHNIFLRKIGEKYEMQCECGKIRVAHTAIPNRCRECGQMGRKPAIIATFEGVDYTAKALAQLFGCSRQNISDLHKRGMLIHHIHDYFYPGE